MSGMDKQDSVRRTRSGREYSKFQMEFTDMSIFELARRATDEIEADARDSHHHVDVTDWDVTRHSPSPAIASPPSVPLVARTESLVPLATHPSLKRPRDELDDKPEQPATSYSPPRALSKSNQRQKDRRQAKRRAERAENPTELKKVVQQHVRETKHIKLDFEVSSATEPLAATGYVCLPDFRLNERRQKAAEVEDVDPVYLPERRAYSADELLGMGFTKKSWKGDTVETILSSEGYPLVYLCGQPRDTADSNWQQDVVEPATAALHKASAALYEDAPFQGVYYGKRSDSKRKANTRRRTHRAETMGVGMGGGQTQPAQFLNDVVVAALMAALFATTPFQRLLGFTNAMFKTCASGLHGYYARTMNDLHSHLRHLPRLFRPALSVFASITLNLGPQTATLPHLDLLNLAWGLCFITALGMFDPLLGGHLVLWDLKLIIEFPPGSTIAIPSALLRHSNTSLQAGEIRYSVTQFSAGGLFRYVENGFQLQEQAMAGMTTDEMEARAHANMSCFEEGLKMYTQSENTI
ncbi:hypothetical protein C8F01DRAFT_1085757 [Mycena amicta]|nr:hypothetical protein C8F01DRAFT_1085757 [Mycena amicta]